MEKNISFATERMGMSESLIEGATQRVNKEDDLEIEERVGSISARRRMLTVFRVGVGKEK